MGCGSSTPEPSDAYGGGGGGTTASNSTNIQRQLERDHREEQSKIKMLLLGAGESGKSTIFKQMRILYGAPNEDDYLKMIGVVVRSNITTAIRKLCMLLRNLDMVDGLDKESEGMDTELTPRAAFDELIAHLVDSTAPPQAPKEENGEVDWVGKQPRAGPAANNEARQFLAHVDAIEALWKSETMKIVWTKRAQMNVIDSHKDFLNDIRRIASTSFKPTTQDLLLSRVRTTQVIVEKYNIDGIDFEMYDVGGQRSERRKWIDCFDTVDSVIFVAALSEFDQTMAEAKHTNRMSEAIELFRSVCNNRAFANTSIMLFLNKKDIFAEKIQYSDIASQNAFSDYAGPPKDFDAGVDYFIQKFKDCLIDEDFNDSFIHVTCATDTNNMEFVLESSRLIIMQDNLRKSGIIGD